MHRMACSGHRSGTLRTGARGRSAASRARSLRARRARRPPRGAAVEQHAPRSVLGARMRVGVGNPQQHRRGATRGDLAARGIRPRAARDLGADTSPRASYPRHHGCRGASACRPAPGPIRPQRVVGVRGGSIAICTFRVHPHGRRGSTSVGRTLAILACWRSWRSAAPLAS